MLNEEVDKIREASRVIVRELGFLNKGLAGTNLSPSDVHAIVEIGNGNIRNASQLGLVLGLEKSTISRLLMKLAKKNLVKTNTSDPDARIRNLILTGNGQKQFEEIEIFGRKQVNSALCNLSLVD